MYGQGRGAGISKWQHRDIALGRKTIFDSLKYLVSLLIGNTLDQKIITFCLNNDFIFIYLTFLTVILIRNSLTCLKDFKKAKIHIDL